MKLNSHFFIQLFACIFMLNCSTIIFTLAKTQTGEDSTFRTTIAPYINCTEKICISDTFVNENMGFPNIVVDLPLQSFLKTQNSLLKPILDFEKKRGLCYRISNLIVLKKTDCYICLFYINAAWDRSRSLVYAVYDSSGSNMTSEILSTEDELFNNNENYYKQTAVSIQNNLLELLIVFCSDFYSGKKDMTEFIQYKIEMDGSLTKLYSTILHH